MTPNSTGAAAKRVKVITDADLKANGGAYTLLGQKPVRVYGVTEAETKAQGGPFAVEGNIAVPVYIVGSADEAAFASALESAIAPVPVFGVDALAAGSAAIPVFVAGGSLGGGPPAAPTDLTAVPTGAARDDVQLDWTIVADDATHQVIERSYDNAAWDVLEAAFDAATGTYTDTAPDVDEVMIYYRVKAVNASGSSAYASVTIAGLLLSLAIYYALDEASGTRADSVGSRDLTDNNTVGSATGHLYALAADFVPANDEYLSRAYDAGLSLDTKDFAFALGVYPTAEAGIPRLLGRGPLKAYYFSNEDQFGVAYRGVEPHAGGAVPNAWYLVYIDWQYSTETLRISVNGGAFTTAIGSSGSYEDSGELFVGRASDGFAFFEGRIGPAAHWLGRRLSDAQIAALYNSGAWLGYPFS